MRRMSSVLCLTCFCIGGMPMQARAADVLTYHNNNARTGLNDQEVLLRPSNVNTNTFRKLFSQPIDGQAYAQPLYKANVAIAGKGTHNVVFVATQHNSVYAFDADDNTGLNASPLWHTSFIDPTNGVTSVPYQEITNAQDIVPEVGITGTPVIDPDTGTLYVSVKTKEAGVGFTNYVQRLHALDISDGSEKFGGPVVIGGSVPGTGEGNIAGTITFDPKMQSQRAGLLLYNGVVYIAFGSHADIAIFRGWFIGYNATNLQQVSILCTSPDSDQNGIWMSGGAPSVDADGNLFLSTGNGMFDADTGGKNYGDSILKLTVTNGIQVADYFTPFNESSLSAADDDLGSGGTLLIPDQPGAHPHLLVVAGKEGRIYLLDRDNLGGFNPLGDSQIVQSLTNVLPITHFGTPAYWNNHVYFWAAGDFLKALQLTNGLLTTTAVSQNNVQYNFPGTTPCVTSEGSTNAIVWALKSDGYVIPEPSILYAYDARDVSVKLYDSNQAGTRDQLGVGVKFTRPTVADGKVFIGTQASLDVLGLIGSATPPAVAITSPITGAVISNLSVDVSGTIITNNSLASLVVNNSRGGSTPALVTDTNWTAAGVKLRKGTNVLTIVATDTFSNTDSDAVTVVVEGTNLTSAVNTTLRTTRAKLTIGATDNSDVVSVSGVFNPVGVNFATGPVTVQFGDTTATIPASALVNLKYKAKASPTNTLTGLSFTLKKRAFSFAASGFTLTNADSFEITITLGTNTLGPDSISFPVSVPGKYSWSFAKPQLPDMDQFFLGKSKLTTNSFSLTGNVIIGDKPDVRTQVVEFGVGSFGESLATNGWVKGTGNVYTYARPVGFAGAVQSMTLNFDLGTWSANSSGVNLTGLTTNAPTPIKLILDEFDATYPALLLQKGTSFSY